MDKPLYNELVLYHIQQCIYEIFCFKMCKGGITPDSVDNTIDERRSKIVRNRVLDCHLSPVGNTVSSDFDPRSSIVKSVFECRLSDVIIS